MPTIVLVSGTTEASSDDITVVAGTPVNVGAFRDDEAYNEDDFRGQVFRKGPDENYNPTNFTITMSKPNLLIVGAGVYQVRRFGALASPVGFYID